MLFKRLLDFAPLILFSYYSSYYSTGLNADVIWKQAFCLGALLAALRAVYYLYKNISFDYIAVGCDVFLTGGALGFLGLYPLLIPYTLFKQSTIFFFISIVGLIVTYARSQGFIQVEGPRPNVLRASWQLLGISVGIFALSLLCMTWLKTHMLLGVVIPFIVLLHSREFLQERLKRAVRA